MTSDSPTRCSKHNHLSLLQVFIHHLDTRSIARPERSRQIDKGSAKISDTENISALFLLLLPDSAGNRSMQFTAWDGRIGLSGLTLELKPRFYQARSSGCRNNETCQRNSYATNEIKIDGVCTKGYGMSAMQVHYPRVRVRK